MKSYLEFERDIKVLEEELERLKDPFKKDGLTEVETDKITQIQTEIDDKLHTTYANLNEAIIDYIPKNISACWATNTPCVGGINYLEVKKKFGFNIFLQKKN